LVDASPRFTRGYILSLLAQLYKEIQKIFEDFFSSFSRAISLNYKIQTFPYHASFKVMRLNYALHLN